MDSSDRARLLRAPRGFATRRVPPSRFAALVRGEIAPHAGDLVLARVDQVGHHTRVELSDGRRRHLFQGDDVVLAYAHRYAPRQFEAIVPPRLDPCHMVAAGGIAAKATSRHSRIARGPTAITPLGLIANEADQVLNVADFALPGVEAPASSPTVIAVLGSSMDSGKSTTAAFLARGVSLAGLRVGYAKVTGTGAGGDVWLARDAGASPALDFTDAGFASTYRVAPREVERILSTLLGHVGAAGVDVAILEVADGPFQPETAALLESALFREVTDGALFAAPDSLAAAGGVQMLRRAGLNVMAVSGLLTSSALQEREALLATQLPVLGRRHLADAATARKLVAQASGRGRGG